MWQTARDLLKYVYLHIRQYWANYAISSSLFLVALQVAMDELWAATEGTWNRTHRKEVFTNFLVADDNVLKIQTDYPIDRLDKAYYWKMSPMDWSTELCDCPDDPLEMGNDIIYTWCSPCYFWLIDDSSLVEVNQITAQWHLIDWQRQISWSDVAWMWWHYWRIVSLKLPRCSKDAKVNWLYITYYRWPQQIESFDDIIMVPKSYWNLLALICAKYLLPIAWASRVNIETYFDQKIDQLIRKLKEKDTIYPTGFRNKAV